MNVGVNKSRHLVQYIWIEAVIRCGANPRLGGAHIIGTHDAGRPIRTGPIHYPLFMTVIILDDLFPCNQLVGRERVTMLLLASAIRINLGWKSREHNAYGEDHSWWLYVVRVAVTAWRMVNGVNTSSDLQ